VKHFIARDELVGTKRAAELTGLDRRAIKHYAENGKLKFERVAGTRKRRYRLSELRRLLNEGGRFQQSATDDARIRHTS